MLKKLDLQVSELKTCMIKSSSESISFTGIFSPRTSIQQHFMREFVTLGSTDFLTSSSRDSEYLIGLNLTKERDTTLIFTQDNFGKKLKTSSNQNGHPISSTHKDLSPSLSTGSELSGSVRVTVLDSSSTRPLNP